MPCLMHTTPQESCLRCFPAPTLMDVCPVHNTTYSPEDGCAECMAAFSRGEMQDAAPAAAAVPVLVRPRARNLRREGRAAAAAAAVDYKGHFDAILTVCGRKYRNKSRVTKLLDLLEQRPPPTPAQVMQELTRTRRRTKRFARGTVESKYGRLLDALQDACAAAMRIPRTHRRQSFYQHLHIGAENEIPTTLVCCIDDRGQAVEIGYGMVMAATKARTDIADIPYVELQCEGGDASTHRGKTCMVEHIGGPISPHDELYEASRECLQVFLDQVAALPTWPGAQVRSPEVGRPVIPLSDFLAAYNAALPGGRMYKHFRLAARSMKGRTWYIGASGRNKSEGTQLNFEAPLRNLREPRFLALLDPATENRKTLDKALEVAQRRARSYCAGSETFPAILALYYWWAAVDLNNKQRKIGQPGRTAEVAAHAAKNRFELLQKCPINDLVRVALGPADRARLAQQLRTREGFDRFIDRLNRDIRDTYNAGYALRKIEGPPDYGKMTTAIFRPGAGARYEGETATAYGNAVKPRCKTERCLRPEHSTGAHATDRDALAAAERPLGTATGKPLPPQLHWVEGQEDPEPVVIFEVRIPSNAINLLGKSASKDNADAFRLFSEATTLTPEHLAYADARDDP